MKLLHFYLYFKYFKINFNIYFIFNNLVHINYLFYKNLFKKYFLKMGIGDWGLWIGDWG